MKNRTLIVAAMTIGFSYFAPGVASADMFITSPYGNAPVRAWVGRSAAYNAHIIQWIRKSDGACVRSVLSSASGLSDNVVARGGNGADDIKVAVRSFQICADTLSPPIYNGYFIDLDGFDGNDALTSGSGDTWLWGGRGNDILVFSNPTGSLLGYDGDDMLFSISTIFTGESLFGENGNDCLEDTNAAALNFDCGPGNDRATQNHMPANAVSCETVQSECTFSPNGP